MLTERWAFTNLWNTHTRATPTPKRASKPKNSPTPRPTLSVVLAAAAAGKTRVTLEEDVAEAERVPEEEEDGEVVDTGDTGIRTVPLVPVGKGEVVTEPVEDLLGLDVPFCEALMVLVTEIDRDVVRV